MGVLEFVSGDRPIRWLVAADSDASAETRKAFSEAGITLRQEIVDALSDITVAKNGRDISEWQESVRDSNRKLVKAGTNLHFIELDLEEAALSSASSELLNQVCELANWTDAPSKDEILSRLGAKAFGSGQGKKTFTFAGILGNTSRRRRYRQILSYA